MLELLEWVAGTRWSVALLESLYVWPLVESTHVLTLTVFVGLAVVHDLRLLGVTLTRVPVSEVTARLLPWMRGGGEADRRCLSGTGCHHLDCERKEGRLDRSGVNYFFRG